MNPQSIAIKATRTGGLCYLKTIDTAQDGSGRQSAAKHSHHASSCRPKRPKSSQKAARCRLIEVFAGRADNPYEPRCTRLGGVCRPPYEARRRPETRMISTRPNLAYLKTAWAAHASISAENCHQSYEDAGITFEQFNHSWIVRKNDTQVSTMPLRYTRQELRMGFLGRIEMEARKAAAEIDAVLFRYLELPDDHTIIVELEESMRHLRRHGNRALTILVGPSVLADAPEQVFIEMRVFLDAPRACLYAHRDGTDLLANLSKRERHPRAGTYAELAKLVASTLNTAIEQVVSTN